MLLYWDQGTLGEETFIGLFPCLSRVTQKLLVIPNKYSSYLLRIMLPQIMLIFYLSDRLHQLPFLCHIREVLYIIIPCLSQVVLFLCNKSNSSKYDDFLNITYSFISSFCKSLFTNDSCNRYWTLRISSISTFALTTRLLMFC